MVDLRVRFGRLLAAHRKRRGLTQDELAEIAELSVDMISKIEVGASGARFAVVERLATALDIDPAELFTTEISKGTGSRETLTEITSRLALLSDADLNWVKGLLDAGLLPRSAQLPGTLSDTKARKKSAAKRQ